MANTPDPKLQAAFNALVDKANISMENQAEITEDINKGLIKTEATLKAVTGSAESASDSFELIKQFTATTTFQVQNVSFLILNQSFSF